jgi:hypothetical protein
MHGGSYTQLCFALQKSPFKNVVSKGQGQDSNRLKKYVHEYSEHVRVGVIARLLEKDRGETIHWYETVKEIKTDKKGRQKLLKVILQYLRM